LAQDINQLRKIVENEEHRFTLHALERMIERNIQPIEIKEAILNGEILEIYPEDKYSPSCLIIGKCSNKILHIQCSFNPVWIITAYDPTLSPEKWDKHFKKRKNL